MTALSIGELRPDHLESVIFLPGSLSAPSDLPHPSPNNPREGGEVGGGVHFKHGLPLFQEFCGLRSAAPPDRFSDDVVPP